MEILNKHPLLKRSMPTSNKNMYNVYIIVHKAIVCINNNYYVHICILLKLKFIAIKVKVGP